MSFQAPILVIGAGLAGLSLGQSLKQSNIPFQIFERDQAASFRAQGYRIRIDQQGGNALKRLLPPSLFALFEETSAKVISGGHRFDPITLAEISGQGSMPPQCGQAWNADRTVLRNLLMTGLEEHIVFYKALHRYAFTDDGRVTAYFEDGSNVTGSILIGADGVHSRVRRQLFPDHVLLDTGGRAFFGKTLIEATTFDTIPKQIDAGISLAVPADEARVKLLTDIMRFDQSSSRGDVDGRNLDTILDLPPDYIYWVLVFHKSCLSPFTSTSSSTISTVTPIQLLTKSWHHCLSPIFSSNSPSQSPTLLHFSLSLPDQLWPQPQTLITLIGDSAHAMPPVGGVGANLAFQDAADLADVLRTGQVSQEGVARYEKVMRERGYEAVERSVFGAKRFFGMRGVEELEKI